MFGFMKKHSERDREEKERKKKEKKDKKDKKKSDKPMTQEELYTLEEAKKGLFRRLSDAAKYPKPHSSKNGSATVTPSQSNESLDSSGKNSPREGSPDNATYTSSTKIELSKAFKVPPPVRPKPKKGILKGNSSYGPGIPNQGVRGDLDDTRTLEVNTIANEMMSDAVPGEAAGDQSPVPKKQRSVKSMISNFEQPDSSLPIPNQSFPTGSLTQRSITSQRYSVQNQDSTEESVTTILELPPTSPAEKTYSVELKLPSVAPPRCPQPRQIILRRQPAGDFGFTLRRGTVLERGLGDNSERKRTVIFAEPGPKNTQTGLLPGDRLIEVNEQNVENSTREDIIELIKGSGNEASLKVQPIPELSELSMRSGLQGGDVMIEQHSVKTGTLQRSGSMRYKTKQAKSEDQLASEKAWLSGEKVWLVHKGGFASGHLQSGEATEEEDGKCKVTLDHGGEVLDVDEEDVEKANPPQFDRVEDLATLRYLNESSLLHTLRQRYGSNLIHSHAGRSLLIINPMHPLSVYSEKVIHMFRGCKPEDMPPHIYAIAQTAYRNMLNTRLDQSLVLLGRSGSGKTANARHALHYFTITAGSVCNILTVEKLNAIFTLLDAFGNSRTILNTSATRFSQIFSLDFDHAGQIAAASIQILMLERTRITKRPEGEPTFHIFYQLLAGLDSSVRKELQLENLNDPNLFMTPLQRAEDRQRATQAWAKIHHSMTVLGFAESETKAIYSVLAGIYHLGVAAVVKGVHNKYQFARPAAAQKAAAVLGTTVEELARAIFSPQTKAPYRGTPEKTGPAETVSGLEALEGFVVGLYSEVFNALVSIINRSLSSNYRTISSLLIVDTPGFQNPASCGRTTGATFEDLCYNYEQERLQLLFHDTVFTSQQDLYSQENVDCDFEMMSSSPGPMVNLIDKPSDGSLVRSGPGMQDAQQKGLLWVLDEEAIYPGNTDEAFLQRVLSTYKHPANTKRALIKAGDLPSSFLLNHFQGTNPVQYNTKGWLKASRENPVSRVATTFLQDSHKEDINGLFATLRGPLATTVSGSVVGIEGSSSLRRASSIRRAYTTGTAGLKRKSTCLQVKFQMDSIIETLRRTRVHFVHCLLPQHNAGLCDLKPTKPGATEDIMMNVPLVRSQVRGMELVEAIRMHRQGFPEHMMFSEFRRRFEMLIPPESKPSGPVVDEKQAVEVFLSKLEVDKSTFRLGLSQVFFRSGGLAQLEDARDEKMTDKIVELQAVSRGYLARQKAKKLKLQHLAVRCIQRNVQKFMAVREWTWWRLYTKVQPLLNVHRTEEELKAKEVELDQIKMKFEKLEKERNEYKQAADRLGSKLTEISVDFAEEHSTSNHATEMLETEAAERMRLERELKDIQVKYSALQRKQEMTEMDLMQARMIAASLDDADEDEVDGVDSVYRERYERSRRENDFQKKKLLQQHEEEIEKYEQQKKQYDRKLAEAHEINEEFSRQAANQKRKGQRQNQEMQDLKLHLEEQVSRNADLEKKQRKFDTELQKVNSQMKDEKALREKLHREKDEFAAEKFTLEQEVKNVKVDFEIQTEKMERLDKELLELGSSGNKDDKEVLHLKRIKNEFERKTQDQEEELDEQAGTIQQLEQAKLRLEMGQEKIRQQHAKELDEKEQELEEMRSSTHKKIKTYEGQIEEEYEEKQTIIKEKRELERKLKDLSEQTPSRDRDVEKRLRKDLRKTKALLQDAQRMLEKQKDGSGKNTVKQLRNQLEDSEYATTAAVKARKGVELELQELQHQLDSISKSKQDVENKCSNLSREKNDIQSRLDDNEEEMAEILKKYKALVQQQSTDYIKLEDQSKQVEEFLRENQQLKEQNSQLESQIEFLHLTTVDKENIVRLEAKIRELENRLAYEQTTRHLAEVQVERTKDQVELLTQSKDNLENDGAKHNEVVKRLQREVRDAKEEHGELEVKHTEALQRKQDLQSKAELLEADYEQSQANLRLAFKRIADLQAVIEEGIDTGDEDDDSDNLDSDTDDTDTDSDDETDMILVNHRASRTSSVSSVPMRAEQASVGSEGDAGSR